MGGHSQQPPEELKEELRSPEALSGIAVGVLEMQQASDADKNMIQKKKNSR